MNAAWSGEDWIAIIDVLQSYGDLMKNERFQLNISILNQVGNEMEFIFIDLANNFSNIRSFFFDKGIVMTLWSVNMAVFYVYIKHAGETNPGPR